MKKLFFAMLSIILILCSGCDGIYEKAELNQINEYKKMWDFYGNRSLLKSFPESLDNLNVLQFDCSWESFTWTGCGFEVLLSVKYDKNSFDDEIERLSSLYDLQQMQYDTSNFRKPAYVAMIGYDYCNEYVLIDESTYTLQYIYIQLLDKEELKYISNDALPLNYGECGEIDNFCFSIYDSPNKEQYGYELD